MIDLPVPARDHDAPGHPRLAGFLVALAIATGVLLIERMIFHSWITILGVLVAPYLGWCLGPEAASFRRPARTVLEMAFVAVVFGAVLMAAQLTTSGASTSEPALSTVVLQVVGLALLGLVIFGIPALILATGCALAWYFAVCWLARRSAPRATAA